MRLRDDVSAASNQVERNRRHVTIVATGSAAHLNRKGHHNGHALDQERLPVIVFDGVSFEIEPLDEGDDEPHSKHPRIIDDAVTFRRLQRLLDLSTAIHEPYGLFDRQEWCRLPP